MKVLGGNGHIHKHTCQLLPWAEVVDKTVEGPALALCNVPIPAHAFSSRLPENKVDLCRQHLRAKLRRKQK